MISYLYNDLVRKNAVATRMVFVVINLLGASPYNPNLKRAYKKLLDIIYSVLLMGCFTTQILICIYAFLNKDLPIPLIMLLVQNLCGSVAPILIITQVLYSREALQQKIDNIAFVDQCLYSAGIEVDFIKLEQIINRLFKYFTVYTIIFWGLIVFLFLNTITNVLGYSYTILMAILFSSPILYSIYYTYYFCAVVIYFTIRFQFLNEAMESLTEYRKSNWIRSIRVKPHNLVCLKKIETIKFVHGVYRMAANDHNRDCDLFITIQFLQSLLITSISVYVLMYVRIGYDSFNDTDINIVSLFITLSIAHYFLINVCSTIFCCAHSSIEFIFEPIIELIDTGGPTSNIQLYICECGANNMEALVHKLMGETEDNDDLQLLEDFSLELLHEKLTFTACDFFVIDFSLFTKIAGAVVSYVIIFLQFGKLDYTNIFHPFKNETVKLN